VLATVVVLTTNREAHIHFCLHAIPLCLCLSKIYGERFSIFFFFVYEKVTIINKEAITAALLCEKETYEEIV
jgi:hypothetical protein